MIRLLSVLSVSCVGSIAAAHPHVFVDTEVEIIVDDAGQMAGIRLTWIYDDFFSLLLTEELEIDPDGDMVLTPEENQKLADFVLDWPVDYNGDLYVTAGGQPVDLGPAQQHSVELVDGLVKEVYMRPLASPGGAAVPVTVQVYDPYYYVAYQIVGEIRMTGGTGCAADYQTADLDTAYTKMDELLYGRPASDVGPEEAFPEVGNLFADTVTVTCGG